MKFGEIIREAGIKPGDVPNAAQLPVVLFDSKEREIRDNPLRFADPIFEKNPMSRAKFLNFCVELESKLCHGNDCDKPTRLHAQIMDSVLLVNDTCTAPRLFFR